MDVEDRRQSLPSGAARRGEPGLDRPGRPRQLELLEVDAVEAALPGRSLAGHLAEPAVLDGPDLARPRRRARRETATRPPATSQAARGDSACPGRSSERPSPSSVDPVRNVAAAVADDDGELVVRRARPVPAPPPPSGGRTTPTRRSGRSSVGGQARGAHPTAGPSPTATGGISSGGSSTSVPMNARRRPSGENAGRSASPARLASSRTRGFAASVPTDQIWSRGTDRRRPGRGRQRRRSADRRATRPDGGRRSRRSSAVAASRRRGTASATGASGGTTCPDSSSRKSSRVMRRAIGERPLRSSPTTNRWSPAWAIERQARAVRAPVDAPTPCFSEVSCHGSPPSSGRTQACATASSSPTGDRTKATCRPSGEIAGDAVAHPAPGQLPRPSAAIAGASTGATRSPRDARAAGRRRPPDPSGRRRNASRATWARTSALRDVHRSWRPEYARIPGPDARIVDPIPWRCAILRASKRPSRPGLRRSGLSLEGTDTDATPPFLPDPCQPQRCSWRPARLRQRRRAR